MTTTERCVAEAVDQYVLGHVGIGGLKARLVDALDAACAAARAAEREACLRDVAQADYGFNSSVEDPWPFDGYTPEDAARDAAAHLRADVEARICARTPPPGGGASAGGRPAGDRGR